MPYCPRCGVETDPSVRSCPLCRTPIPVLDDLGPGEPAWPSGRRRADDPAQTYITPAELRSRAFLTVTALLATAAVAVSAVDLLISQTFGWSLWPLASLAFVWGLTASALTWHRNRGLWFLAWTGLTLVFLAVLDGIGGGRPWFLPLGLPLVTATAGLAALGAWLFRRPGRRGYNLFAVTAVLLAAGLTAVDLLVTAWTGALLTLGWSLVTDLVLLPLAFLFLLLHLTLHRAPDFRRIFHF